MISYLLKDDLDINEESTLLEKQWVRWMDIYTKQLVFMTIAINFLLWGCKTWALRKDLLLRLKRFVTRQIRRIIGTNMYLVQKYKITLDEMRQRFNNMPSVRVLIDVQTTQFLGNILRSRAKSSAHLLLISFIPSSYVLHNAQTETGFRHRTRPIGIDPSNKSWIIVGIPQKLLWAHHRNPHRSRRLDERLLLRRVGQILLEKSDLT